MAGDRCTTEAAQPLLACRLIVCACVSQLLLGPLRHNNGLKACLHSTHAGGRPTPSTMAKPACPKWGVTSLPNTRERQSVAANLHGNGVDAV